ncbi:MAG: hypothetical protein ACRC28_08475 [Clostridium sp.]|uniref:hypothetical protein n=1 Tax=Clostridium sp. TaxID=1506 RepID=UPI003F38DE28
MKKVAFMMLSLIFISILGEGTIAFAKEKNGWGSSLMNLSKSVVTSVLDSKISFPMECLDDIGKCDCENTYKSHENKLKEGIKKEERKITCNCGGVLSETVVSTGKWSFSNGVKCTHGRGGYDYIYEKRVVTTYECTKCSFYTEVDRNESKKECIGV